MSISDNIIRLITKMTLTVNNNDYKKINDYQDSLSTLWQECLWWTKS